MLALLLLLPALAASSVLPPGAPFVLQELRRHKINLAVLDALHERVLVERDPEVKEALGAHFRESFQRSFQDASGWLHLAVISHADDPHTNLIAAAWRVFEGHYTAVQRLLEREVLPLMGLASKLKLAFHAPGPRAEFAEVKAALERQSAEMARRVRTSLEAFRRSGWRAFLPQRLAAFQADRRQRWMLASQAVPELQQNLTELFPFRSFLVVSFDKDTPPRVCSNGSATATEHRLRVPKHEWDVVVLSVPAEEGVHGHDTLRFFSKVQQTDTVLRCKSQTDAIFADMEVPCRPDGTPLVVAVVSAEEGIFYYSVSERPIKQLKVQLVTRGFPAICKRAYALMGLGGVWRG